MDLPFLQLLNPRHPPLRIRHHLRKQIRKSRLAQLRRLGPIKRAVVDRLAVRWVSEPGITCARPAVAAVASGWWEVVGHRVVVVVLVGRRGGLFYRVENVVGGKMLDW